MSDTKLKPCPFCGGEAKYIEDRDFFISRFVTCTKCGIETKRNYLKRKDAIRDWNTRKPIDRIVGQLEEQSDYEPIDYDYCDMACSGEQYFIATDKAIEIVKAGGIDG